MNSKLLIRPETPIEDAVVKLSAGNPGALDCLMSLVRFGNACPTRLFAFPFCVDMFDRLGLRGSELYMLWNDCLDRDVVSLLRLVDDWRQGLVDDDFIHRHVNASGGRGIPIPLPARRCRFE